MFVVDVNVFVAAHREAAPDHVVARAWLTETLTTGGVVAITPVVVAGFVRVVTSPCVFDPPSTLQQAWAFVDRLRSLTACVDMEPGPRFFDLLRTLTLQADARGNLVTDAFVAAMALETRSTVVSFDRDFARFDGLDWLVPGA